ncbi:transketolase-like TK C-terminal-containing protein [[Mycoplasma] testudinis]|uniref:transketolase-like TK C-terminal-containing protein n=1 Tax=[Mycoplasma] testudinis TaxID=33924 RepID=UPI000696F852|nr:transketolase [[Mycoplasma] testudinis]
MKKEITSKKVSLDELAVNTIRVLGVEMIQKANSGHPGIVLGASSIIYALFKNHLSVNQKDLNYVNRDRFILSAGHGSALLYATMLVSEYPSIKMEDVKAFRQINSKTSGHPEMELLKGVDYGTGPLGQGAATSVGFAIAEANMNARYPSLINHYTYCLLGDGCMQEGVIHESLAIAGRYKLNKLIWLFDSNRIQLDGKVSDSTITDYSQLVKAHGWDYICVEDGMDYNAVSKAIAKAKTNKKPTFIECKTVIGYESPFADSHNCHGAPLGSDNIAILRKNLNYEEKPFTISKKLKGHFKAMWTRGESSFKKYEKNLASLKTKKPEIYKTYVNELNNKLNLSKEAFAAIKLKDFEASRNLAGEVFKVLSDLNKNIMVVNIDLSGSTKIKPASGKQFDVNDYTGQNINVGVREFAATAITTGIIAHKGLLAVTSTFMSFADYCKPALRLAAINGIPTVCVFSHDSISVGEDGPTHQPVEQLTMLRSMPKMEVYRPANLFEMCNAFVSAFTSNHPTAIITSRAAFKQSHPVGPKVNPSQPYFVLEPSKPKFLIFATGSEVGTALNLADRFAKDNVAVGVLSIPTMTAFRDSSIAFLQTFSKLSPFSVLLENGSSSLWGEFFKHKIGLDSYGVSGKPEDVMKHFGLDEDSLYKKISNIFLKQKPSNK